MGQSSGRRGDPAGVDRLGASRRRVAGDRSAPPPEDGRPVPSATPRLSELDLRILSGYARGMTLEVIARENDLSERTVRRRIRQASDALGVNTGIEAVVTAVRRGLI